MASDIARGSGPGGRAGRAPVAAYLGLLCLDVWLFPPKPPVPDAGLLETLLTVAGANAIIFGIVFGMALAPLWGGAWLMGRRPTRIIDHVANATILATVILLLGAVARWYSQQPLA